MHVVKRMMMVAVMLCGIIFSISTPAVSAGHEKSTDDAPPSPEDRTNPTSLRAARGEG